MALRTLELSHESEQLRIDAIVLDVFLYPGEESAIASDMRRAHVFR